MTENTAPLHLAKYGLAELLGSGGSAEVWKAFDTQLQRFVVLKLLRPDLRNDPAFQRRFLHEAQLIARLHHPNIVQIHDFQIWQPPPPGQGPSDAFFAQPIAYMVMDYVEGPTLADYIQRTSAAGHIPALFEVAGLFMSICQAVAYAHRQGMIHRDLKPTNILLDWRNTHRNPMGEPILTDFGIARLLSASSAGQTEVQFGTPAYISPEQIHGQAGTERSDIYALGVILYEITTGVLPFSGDQLVDITHQHLTVVPLVPSLVNPRLPPALVQVIMRCLAKDPTQRFASASSLMVALAHALSIPVPTDMPGTTPAYSIIQDSSPLTVTPNKQATDLFQSQTVILPEQPRQTPVLQTGPSLRAKPTLPPNPRRPQRWLTVLIVALLAALGFAGLGLWLIPKILAPLGPATGQAFYTSSGQFVPGSARGVADKVQVDLQNLPSPPSGKSYYLWLLGDTNPIDRKQALAAGHLQPPLLLTNNLPLNNGHIHYVFPGTAQHDNLLAISSRLLITEEDAGLSPETPSSDRQTWRYFATIPQQTIGTSGYSALSHIRHLLYDDLRSPATRVPGGVAFWMMKNTEKILEWSIAARDNWYGTNTTDGQISLMRAQFIRILDFLDGVSNVHVDLPAGTPIMVNADDARGARALLTVDPLRQSQTNLENPFGLLDHTQHHIGQVARATDIPSEMRTQTSHVLEGVQHARVWLSQVRTLTIALFKKVSSSYAQMREAEVGKLLDDLVTNATYAYIGQRDPITLQIRTGVIQAYYAIQQLTVLTITNEIPQRL
jgi:serine/threonine protein kinase